MKFAIYSPERWDIHPNDFVFVPFRVCPGDKNNPMVLDADSCASTPEEAKEHWWFRDCPDEASVRQMNVSLYVKKYVINRHDMNPFFTLKRMEMLSKNMHLTNPVVGPEKETSKQENKTMRQNKYQIGDKFIPLSKRKDVHTIVDIHRTYNAAGEEVKMVYIAEHEFMRQKIRDEVVEATITRGLMQYGIPE